MTYYTHGLQHRKGTNKDGKEYDFYQIHLLIPINPNYSDGKGYYSQSKFITKQQYDELSKSIEKFICQVDLNADLNGRITDLSVIK